MDPRFQHALLTIRMEEIQKEDWEFLQTCVLTQLSPVERAMFDNAVVLLSMNKEVDERNMHMMERARRYPCRKDRGPVPCYLKGRRCESRFGLLH